MLRWLAVSAVSISVIAAWFAADKAHVSAAEEKSAPPSFLIFVADDVSWKDFGCYGNKAIQTPNIDAMAKDGLRFTHAFLTTSSCSPTRISVLTGKYPHATGAEDLHMPLPDDQNFVTTHLKEQGYFTGHMRKTHYGPNGNKQFDWYSKGVNEFDKFLDECGERPFFMWVGFSDAHRPYKQGSFDPPHDPAKVEVPAYLVDDEATRQDLALYYDEIARMDSNIGKMIAELKKRGRLDDTLCVFFADNGMPFPRAKGTAYDSGIGTPLVMMWPEVIKPGGEHTSLASVIDLAPTVLDAAGLEKPADMQGRSMLKILKNPAEQGREIVFAERNWHNCDEHIRCARTRQYKLIRNAYLDQPFGHPADCSRCPSWRSLLEAKKGGQLSDGQMNIFAAPRPRWELYDLEKDPHELNNLAEDPKYQAVVDELSAALEDWREETGDFPETKRRRADNTNRVTGVKFTRKIAPLTNTE